MTFPQILVQNIETFETITRLTVGVELGETVNDRVDQYLSSNKRWGIVSLDDDTDEEYMAILLVAPIDGPDYEFDAATGEIEPVVNQREVQKEAIIEAIDTIEATKATKKSKKSKTKNTQSNTQKGGKMPKSNKSQTTITAKNHDLLAAFITNNPGVTREVVFNDPGLRSSLLDAAVIKKIDAGDKLETKRWNSRINRFLRKIKRDGVDLQIVGMGKTATYTIGTPSGQLELPFDDAAVARNAAITGDDTDVVIERPAVDPKRAEEAENQMLDFESLLATLDEEEATITSDDQAAFDEAQKMLK
jgi:hypothetical protein